MNIEKIYFRSGKHRLMGNLIIPKGKKKFPAVLICHGAGRATKERFLELQELLLKNGFASFVFDFTGVGESEGLFEEGTLQKRLQDGQNALKILREKKNINLNSLHLIGTSMGGHIASRLTKQFPLLRSVVLLYPAAYAKEAESKPLNEEFTKILRKPRSWKNSPAFSALKKYNGKLLIIYGSEDKVIPREVKKAYKSLVGSRGQYVELEKGTHLLLTPESTEQQKVKLKTYNLIINFLKSA